MFYHLRYQIKKLIIYGSFRKKNTEIKNTLEVLTGIALKSIFINHITVLIKYI